MTDDGRGARGEQPPEAAEHGPTPQDADHGAAPQDAALTLAERSAAAEKGFRGVIAATLAMQGIARGSMW